MNTNEMYFASRESERDFTLRALAAGARIGYDASGTTWAVLDESDPALPEITFLDNPIIWGTQTGDFCPEWTIHRRVLGYTEFRLSGTELSICHNADGTWVYMDGLVKKSSPSPTIPANRIEEMAREQALAAA